MRTSIKIAAILAILFGASNLALADGPVRQGLRAAGEATANVARGVAQGTANVAQGVAQGTANVARGTGNALGLTPATPYQANNGAILDNGRDARWRFARHNGEWWYYGDNNQWQYHRDGQWHQFSQDSFQPMNQQLADNQQFAGNQQPQQHTAAYRGLDQGQQVRHDRQGRAFICDNGRPVYLDQQQPMSQEHEVARQDLNQQAPPQQPTPAQPTPAQPMPAEPQAQQQADATIQSAPVNAAPAYSAPATSGQISGDDVSHAPAGPVSNTEAQGHVAAPREINNTPSPQTNGATENPSR